MSYYKKVSDGYILAIGNGYGSEEITKAEYDVIMAVLRTVPHSPGKGYRLREDLTWEEYELPEPVETDEISEAEALEILLGGAV